MFKITGRGGYRGAQASASSGSGRISGLHGLRGATAPKPQRPAFLPETPQEQTFDSNTPRVDETA